MEENKRKQYAHLYEHHEVEDPQPREEKEKPIGPSGRNRHRPMVEKVCRRIAFSFLAMAVVLLLALNYFQIKEAKKEAVLEYIRKEKQQMKNRETEKTDQRPTRWSVPPAAPRHAIRCPHCGPSR